MRIKTNRIHYEEAIRLYERAKENLIRVCENNNIQILDMSSAGSLRRQKKSIGDIDIVIKVDNIEKFEEVIKSELSYEYIAKSAFYKGKVENTAIDLFVAGKHNFYSMLFFLTGCEDWNKKIMVYLMKNTNYRFLPFMFLDRTKKIPIDFKSESEIFKLIEHSYVSPKNRTPRNLLFKELK